MTAVEDEIPDARNLVKKKKKINTKICEIEKKVTDQDYGEYITISEFNKLTTENFKAKLARANLVTKTGFDTKLTSLNKKINTNRLKHLLVGNELKKTTNI